jgi:hypothetical protein
MTEQAAVRAPDLIEPVVGYRDWRVTDAGLVSPRAERVWRTATMHAACHPRRLEDFVLPPHAAPHPDCNCGIHAYYRFNPQASKVDHRGVCGIVSLWGRIEAHENGMRAEWARVEALGVFARWTARQKNAVRAVADELHCDLHDLADLPAAAPSYGSPLPEVLRPGRPRRRRPQPAAPTSPRRLVIAAR